MVKRFSRDKDYWKEAIGHASANMADIVCDLLYSSSMAAVDATTGRPNYDKLKVWVSFLIQLSNVTSPLLNEDEAIKYNKTLKEINYKVNNFKFTMKDYNVLSASLNDLSYNLIRAINESKYLYRVEVHDSKQKW